MKVNYLIAAWTGNRRGFHNKKNKELTEGSSYLIKHIKFLSKYDHSLDQITIILPERDAEEKEFLDYLKSIKFIKNTPVVILQRKNIGVSYGSWSYAYSIYRDLFDYFIFIEDDYVFAKDNFDQIMISEFNKIDNCGYLCSFVTSFSGKYQKHGSIPHGISSNSVLKKVEKHFNGCLPYADEEMAFPGYGDCAQIIFTSAFELAGFYLEDLTKKYKAPFFNSWGNELQEFAPNAEEYLICPLQMFPDQ